MSEYIDIETEFGDDPAVLYVFTNVPLTPEGEVEFYDSPDLMEEGSPLAQALSFVDGILQLRLEGSEMRVRRDVDYPWHQIVSELSAAIKDFFL